MYLVTFTQCTKNMFSYYNEKHRYEYSVFHNPHLLETVHGGVWLPNSNWDLNIYVSLLLNSYIYYAIFWLSISIHSHLEDSLGFFSSVMRLVWCWWVWADGRRQQRQHGNKVNDSHIGANALPWQDGRPQRHQETRTKWQLNIPKTAGFARHAGLESRG